MSDTDQVKDWQKLADESGEEIKKEEAPKEETPSVDVLDHPSYIALQEKLTAAEQLAHENWDKALRALSELDNVKRRADRDIERATKYGVETFIKELFPIGDSLDQAILSCANDNSDNVKALRSGVELTLKLFHGVLNKLHVEVINPIGETFDPGLHEAISMQQNDTVKPNTVLAVVQNGYRLHDRVLRPARVVVSKG